MTNEEILKYCAALLVRIKALEARITAIEGTRQAPPTYNPMGGPIPWTSSRNEGVTDAEIVK